MGILIPSSSQGQASDVTPHSALVHDRNSVFKASGGFGRD